MTAQVIIEISGGIAEAFNRGGSRLSGRELWAFAEDRCGVGGDLVRAQAVLDDMRRLTGHPFYPHEFAEAASAMLFEHWQAVSALAQVLVVRRRIARRIEPHVGRIGGQHFIEAPFALNEGGE
jgi:hypothetical protein